MTFDEEESHRCYRCGGSLPDDTDEYDDYLTDPETGDCPGRVTCTMDGRVVGCGAWSEDAYRD